MAAGWVVDVLSPKKTASDQYGAQLIAKFVPAVMDEMRKRAAELKAELEALDDFIFLADIVKAHPTEFKAALKAKVMK